jgi:hypothetical protein
VRGVAAPGGRARRKKTRTKNTNYGLIAVTPHIWCVNLPGLFFTYISQNACNRGES